MSESTVRAGVDDDVKAPFVWEDECGGIFYANGHLPPDAAKIALALHLITDAGLSPDEAYESAVDAGVAHRWYRPDPSDPYGERMVQCYPRLPDAGAFTVIACYDSPDAAIPPAVAARPWWRRLINRFAAASADGSGPR